VGLGTTGSTWRKHAEEVNEHDFPGVAKPVKRFLLASMMS